MRRLLVSFALAGGALVALGCNHDDPKRPAVSDDGRVEPIGGAGSRGNVGDSGTATPTPDAGTVLCTDLVIPEATIDAIVIPDNPPPPLGGDLVDGTYDLVDATIYAGIGAVPGPTTTTYRGAFLLSGSSFQRVLLVKSSNGTSQESRTSGTIIAAGAPGNLSVARTCPGAGQESLTYNVNGNNLTLVDTSSKISLTFVKKL